MMTNDEQRFWQLAYLKAMSTRNLPRVAADLAVQEYRNANAKAQASEPARGRQYGDPLDIAYLAIGAADALADIMRGDEGGWQDVFDGYGQDGVIQHVIESADLLRKAWDSLPNGEWNGGVWYYDVSEVLGGWIIRQWVWNNDSPSTEAIEREIKLLMNTSQGQHNP